MPNWTDRIVLVFHAGRQIFNLAIQSFRLRRIVRRLHKPCAASSGFRLPKLPYRQACELLAFAFRVGRLNAEQRRQQRHYTRMFRRIDRYCSRLRPRYPLLSSEPARQLQEAMMAGMFRDALGIELSERSRARLSSFPVVSLALRDVLQWCGAGNGNCSRDRLADSIDFCATDLKSAAECGELFGNVPRVKSALLNRSWRGFARWVSSLDRTLCLCELDQLADSMVLDLANDAISAIGAVSRQRADEHGEAEVALRAVLDQISTWLE